MTRLWEMEAFAGQAARGAAKANPASRRDGSGSQVFKVETDARADTRHALEAARGRKTAAADLAERRDVQRASSERAARDPAAANGASKSSPQTRPGSTDTQRASGKAATAGTTDRQRPGVDDKDERRADTTAKPTGEANDTVDATKEEQASEAKAGSEPASDREVPPQANTPTAGAPPAQMGTPVPPPAKVADHETRPSEALATASVAASAQAETAALRDGAQALPEAGAKTEGEAGFQVHLDDIASTGTTSGAPAVSASSGTVPVPNSAATPHQGAPVPLGAVPMTIGLRSLSGSSHFEIRLDPVDLGRIDVKLDIDKDQGTVTTRVIVDRPETLALLQRDAGSLQQALSQAGLDPSSGIDLSLRGDGTPGGQGSGNQQNRGGADGRGAVPAADLSTAQSITDVAPRMLRGIAGIDIRI